MASKTFSLDSTSGTPSLLTIAPEIRQAILQNLFQGNIIQAELKRFKKEATRIQTEVRSKKTICKVKTETPNVLLVNKQLFREALTLFYEQSQLYLSHSYRTCTWRAYWTCTWRAYWTRYYLEDYVGKTCLRRTRDIQFDTCQYSRVGPMIKLLPDLRVIRLSTCFLEGDAGTYRDLSDSRLPEEIFARRGMEDVRQLLDDHPGKQVFGAVMIRVEDPHRGTEYENMSIKIDFSAHRVLTREVFKQTYEGGVVGWGCRSRESFAQRPE